MKKLAKRDRDSVWHPLTQHKLQGDMLAIDRAEGSYLFDVDGNRYIDAIASWYTAVYGHCNPYILKKVSDQMHQLDQVVFSGFTHKPAIELAERLLEILPGDQSKIFYSDNGSTATEIGIKMALQYHHNLGEKKAVLLAFENAFHGDTFGSMSVSGLSVYNGPFEDWLIEVNRISVPTEDNIEDIIRDLDALLKRKNVAGFIYEPLVQGAAAMQVYKAEHLDLILAKCKEYKVLTIADEVMTGFGKTGKNFASDHVGTKPDICCLSKALTAGLMPMAATSCTEEIYRAFYSDEIAKGLFHGHTYTANPLACSAAMAGLDLLLSPEIQDKIIWISDRNKDFDKHIRTNDKVAGTRQLGIIHALDLKIEMDRYGTQRDSLFNHFMSNGVFLRPLGNTIYIHPPYTISKEDLHTVYSTIETAIESIESN